MIHGVRLDLTVPYARKEEAKALGARWDGTRRLWYAPAGTDLRGFDERWFPDGFPLTVGEAAPAEAFADGEPEKGITLSELLARLKGVITQGMPESVWVRAEISELSAKNGNLYLQLTERTERGDPLGRAKGIIWKARATGITSKFIEATGEGLKTDIKILCLVQVRFDVLYGLDLVIEDVDPSYTLGDLAAKLARIRQHLIDERIFARNQALPAPVEFLRVAVINPETSASLGDFRRETDRPQRAGLCDFQFFGATFQGLDAPSSMRTAFNEAMASHRLRAFDALVIIRGGGAVTDLAWLNDLELARLLCLAPIPILTGIGHERDSTILDEVAHRRFDTPSKVALHIMSTIRDNAMAALAALDRIKLQIARILIRERTGIETQADRIRSGVRTAMQQAEASQEKSVVLIRTTTFYRLQQERAAVEVQADRLQAGAMSVIRQAIDDREEFMTSIRTATHYQLREANQSLDAEYARLENAADQAVCEAGSQLKGAIEGIAHRAQLQVGEQAAALEKTASVVSLKSEAAIESVTCELDHTLSEVRKASFAMVSDAASKVDANMRLVMGLGPQSTLQRGFSISKGPDGRPITSREAASRNAEFTVEFHDGAVQVSNKDFKGGDEP